MKKIFVINSVVHVCLVRLYADASLFWRHAARVHNFNLVMSILVRKRRIRTVHDSSFDDNFGDFDQIIVLLKDCYELAVKRGNGRADARVFFLFGLLLCFTRRLHRFARRTFRAHVFVVFRIVVVENSNIEICRVHRVDAGFLREFHRDGGNGVKTHQIDFKTLPRRQSRKRV